MEKSLDRPMEAWSDRELLAQYRALNADPSRLADQGRLDKSAITEEILRRGLSLPDGPAAAPVTDSVDWGGEEGGEDPGSGALPNPV
ncbi:MAG: hypothetical protein K0T01_2465 [Acidimicrobiia bacterium]|nr:hypothetical protein [Acidimicrobiia bacterium]